MLTVNRWANSQARRDAAEAEATIMQMGEVAEVAALFERRWTMAALRRADADLERRLRKQIGDFHAATITGSVVEVNRQGQATVRGYRAAIQAMDAAGEPDDAYVLGYDYRTGFRVAVGHLAAPADRAVLVEGKPVVFVTPDEVAALLAGIEGIKGIAAIKQMFPGAEVVDVHPGEAAKVG